MMDGQDPWTEPVRLSQVGRATLQRRIVADAKARRDIARRLGLERLDLLEAELTVAPWLDGAEIKGRWRAEIEQTCGVTLEPLPSAPEGDLDLRVLPAGSPNAPEPSSEEEVIDPEAEDPPDVVEGDLIDLGALVAEQLALEIDPFPRKPGAEFVQPEEPPAPSPFEALRKFKADPGAG
jgi:hypothetical protein